MRHRKHNIRFGRQRAHYKITMRHLVSGLIINKNISTTKVKAKEASRLMDKLVTIGKKDSVANRRKAYSLLCSRDLVSILFNEIAPLFKNRKGGYTRVMLTGMRRGDNAQMAILEFVEKPKPAPVTKKEVTKAKPVQIEPKPEIEPKPKIEPKPEMKIEKKEEKREERETKIQPKPKKEEIVKETKVPEKPKEEPKTKSGFFKRLFGKKKDK